MIKGFATPEETSAYADTHTTLEYRALGDTGLWVSQAGFGCYRVADGIESHAAALKKALLEGINLIDTSTNYAGGKSEVLVGRVLERLTTENSISRRQVIVVSKVGYLQGENYVFSQQREAQGKPFKELVDFGEGLAHCIHPEFLEDQIERSLERLSLETIDFLLLHNPEYYLEWAAGQNIDPDTARDVYYGRIRNAFAHLETEVAKGRIRYYGVSSNTLPSPSDKPDFTSLHRLWQTAQSLPGPHHFRMVQLSLNIREPEAVLEKNQPGDLCVLDLASGLPIGVLTNRPLNSFWNEQLFRLADVPTSRRLPTSEIVKSIQAVNRSESALFRKVLPRLDLEVTMQNRIKEQLAVGNVLKHHWKTFGSYERWRQTRSGHLLPRVQGVMDFLSPYRDSVEVLNQWISTHNQVLESALNAVGSLYSEAAAVETGRLKNCISGADPDWAGADSLSQKALRAVRSTRGVTSVLVGMRRESYVDDVIAELNQSVSQKTRWSGWNNLKGSR